MSYCTPYLSLGLYLSDVVTDLYTTYKHYALNHYLWTAMTLTFTIMPMILGCGLRIYNVIVDGAYSHSARTRCFIIVGWICLMPFIPSIWLVRGSAGAGYIKMIEAMSESLPQAGLQTYIITQTLMHPEMGPVALWQYVTVIVSLATLSFTVSTNSQWFPEATRSSRVSFFFFGLLSVGSRLLVGCCYSVIQKPLWLLPSGTALIASVVVWLVKRSYVCPGCLPLRDRPHRRCHAYTIVYVVNNWVLTTFYNNFTLTGLPASTVYLAYAIGLWYLPVPHPAALLATIFTVLSLFVNIIVTVLPSFQQTEEHWLDIKGDGECYNY
ncbi:unnamed protein product [Meganyctiphanes norvegica]|uniref:XK-related protein n=1 Tax=Meganyctiphanes norvegica TaxID=48144 RepID=A0AAV2RRC4_MEGNR